ncbi:hypothetical protein [Liquorilactobacillus nagelii]|jgi:hypothetical protein|uniref:Uncharacterized protein n=1 Tax=Liquorilactobacillus nagelii TaxID=82688 RepID=A0A3Q8CC24_9LACO|nr:hypothetical protein [Liquorilactobacillus nagelii]AUJ31998.1 hypothetical protein BSQ50_05150 [Liquorilactobacillus nagelii]MCC7615143.1 hypothetical protein [Liquorilactobacillus nagelii]MCI1921691.1 hypothetical protein [Liquorilactobacillus nagelii]MCI1976277.1 hypothetical protein [Liquorilactobacillus nagelii]MCP9314807.1 hypothetical protein [Liquorilactobacillus nagelii]
MNIIISIMFIVIGIASIYIGIRYGKRQPIKTSVPILFGFIFGGLYPKFIEILAILLGIISIIYGVSVI